MQKDMIIAEDLEQAKKEYEGYLKATKERAEPYYEKMKQIKYQLSKGHKLINVKKAILAGGLDEKGRPKIAIARADEDWVGFASDWDFGFVFCEAKKRNWSRDWDRGTTFYRLGNVDFELPEGITSVATNMKTKVPKIPPEHLPPKGKRLGLYHILFEVGEWESAPDPDPVLLKRITKDIFVVLAEWELTDLERQVIEEATFK